MGNTLHISLTDIIKSSGPRIDPRDTQHSILRISDTLPSKTTYCDLSVNPIRSGVGALKAPPPIFCSHAFNFGAALL